VLEGHKIRLPKGALTALRTADPPFATVIDRVGPFAMRRARAPTDFVALARAIIYQQLSGKAAATIYGRYAALFPGSIPTAEGTAKVHYATLKKAGISRQKQAALRDLSRHVSTGRLPLEHLGRLPDEELIERLVAVRGIGRWSAQMFLMFHLGRHDVWPEDDLGIRKAVARLYELPEPLTRRPMIEFGVRYRPYRTIASWYLWSWLDGGATL
jgi:3-methyladenine DNA glycosylase/8-oxoguanine DNA glycosylase